MRTVYKIIAMVTAYLVFGVSVLVVLRLPFRWPLDAILLGFPWVIVAFLLIALHVEARLKKDPPNTD